MKTKTCVWSLLLLCWSIQKAVSQCPTLDPISGPTALQACINMDYVYSIPNSAAANLVWTLLPGPPAQLGHFVGPNTGESVTVHFTYGGTATLCATPTNPCYAAPPCLTIQVTDGPFMDPLPDITVCEGDHVQVHFSSSGVNPVYYWTNSNCLMANGNIGLPCDGNGDLDFIAENNTSNLIGALIGVDAIEGDCHGFFTSFKIWVQPLPDVNPRNDTTLCGGTPLSIVFSGTPGATYNWTNSNPAIGLPASGTGNLSFTTALVTSQQTGIITVTPVKNGCPGPPMAFQITVNPVPVLDDPPNQTVCAGDAVSMNFTATGGAPIYQWTNSNIAIGLGASGTGAISFNAAAVSNVQTGTISVRASENNCISTLQTATITVKPEPSLQMPANITVCGGAAVNVNLSGTAGAQFNWTNDNVSTGLGAAGSGTIHFSSASVAQEQTANVSVTPALNGCTGTAVTFSITVRPTPAVDPIPDQQICSGGDLALEFSGTADSYTWANSNTQIGLSAMGSGNLSFTSAQTQATLLSTLTVTPNLNGCKGATVQFSITDHPLPVVTASGGSVGCDTVPTVLHATTSVPGAQFSWSGPGSFSATLQNPVIQYAGIYAVTITDPISGCFNSDTALVLNCCFTKSGTLDTLPLTLCIPKTAQLSHHGDQALLPGDTLRYILFTNPNSPLGSIIQYSDTLFFPFLPGITLPDSLYYSAVIAGHLLANDSIDTAGSCFRFSPGPHVRWRAKPLISVLQQPQAVCADGCVDVTFQFSGTPPFHYTWELMQNGQSVLKKSENTALFQQTVTVCPVDFSPPGLGGPVNFSVIEWGDAFCGCGN